MRRIIAVSVWMIAASTFAQSSFRPYGFLTLRETYVKAQPSWATGGWGRFDVGAATADDHRTVNVDVLQLGVDWTPSSWFLLHSDGLARREGPLAEVSQNDMLGAGSADGIDRRDAD